MVYFVGAGPGDKELITIKGLRYLSMADCVIYAGSLINHELLNYAKRGCEFFDSAKMTLEEVIEVMLKNEKNNLTTARLHTGDPSIYGAIREQMDELDKIGVAYGVVPGVSSFCAAAAALGAEYTLPGVSQSLIITRMGGRTPVPANEDIETFASHGATMILFLSAGMLKEASSKLIAGGYPPSTPAAIVYKASWPDERVFRTTVSELCETACRNNITKTALILVGSFLGDNYERSKLYDPSFTHGYREAAD